MRETNPSPITDPVKAYELAIKMREYELSQTISRNNFFMVFQGVVLAGALGLEGGGAEWVWVAVSILGVALSILQFRMACAGRYQVISTTLRATARELDILATVPTGVTTYHFRTKGVNKSNSVSHSSLKYKKVKQVWKAAGFKVSPTDNPDDIDVQCNLIGHSILKAWKPSEIAIWVAIALVFFWSVTLILQFVDLGAVPKIILY